MRRFTTAALLAVLPVALLCSLAGSVAPSRAPSPAGSAAPGEFVALREVAPGVREDIRYATRRNFTGEVVDGYRDPVCLLTREAARALGRAQRALAAQGLGLLVFDCYRPRRAVADFLRWAERPSDPATKAAYHPRVPKDRLFDEGYLAARSGHSRGSTVDVTLAGPSGRPLDMGTPFDFFDPRSHGASREVTARQRASREKLGQALAAQGFVPVPTEWWHFTHRPEPFPDTYFDFPVGREATAGAGGAAGPRRAGTTPVGPGPPPSSHLTSPGVRRFTSRPACHRFGTSPPPGVPRGAVDSCEPTRLTSSAIS